MRRLDRIKEAISARWSDSFLAPLCIRIIEYLEEIPVDQLDRLTFADLSAASAEPADSDELFQAITLLASRFSVLKWHFVYFNNEGSPYYMSDEETADFLSDGHLVDPNTGELVDEAAQKVSPYFSADKSYLLAAVD